MAALTSDWLRHFWFLLWNGWTEFNETWQEARSQRPLPSLCFSGQSEKQDGHPDLWLAETFSTSPLKPLNRIQRNVIGSKISMSSTKFVFFRAIGKTKWPPWPLIERHFRLLLCKCWTEFKETWQEARSQRPLPSLYFSCWSENKMAALASDWLRHFWLLLWNRWTEFNETWQEARSQRPLPCLYYSGWSVNKNGCPGLKKGGTLYSGLSASCLNLRSNFSYCITIWTLNIEFFFFLLVVRVYRYIGRLSKH